jgi:polyphosphate kinase
MTQTLLEPPPNIDREYGASETESINSIDSASNFFNRELSLLEFYRRVLEEAFDEEQPLLERLKFLSIFSTNLDEFFMIRVSGLKETFEGEANVRSPDGMTAGEQLNEIRQRLLPMIAEHAGCLGQIVLPQLETVGIAIAPYDSLAQPEREKLNQFFTQRIFPLLTPQGVDQGHPFPYISGLSLNLGLMVGPVRAQRITQSLAGKHKPRFVRLKIPPLLPRLIPIDEAREKFVLVEDLIAANVGSLFPRMEHGPCYSFRVTRDADVEVRDEEAVDLLEMMEQTLRRRRFGSPVRLEVSRQMPDDMVGYLTDELRLNRDDVYVADGPLDTSGLLSLYELDKPELKDKPLAQTVPARLRKRESVFDVIRQQDLLLHHPYNSYSVVTDLIKEAARDPQVVAIKMCLYRTGRNSPIPEALIEASERGKQVTALIELKARFDEENNIEWAKRLEESGVHVVYGLVGLKTHSKLTLIVRDEGESLCRYVHVATGNYNPITSGFYTDLGLLTANESIGNDATELFNYLTGFSRQKDYRELIVAPVNMRDRILALIDRETAHARVGRPARIIAKINRLADKEVIRALYRAAQAGVNIDLVVRGICMLRPGVSGLSENINVISIVGRFLEHSRIFYFANGGEEEIYIGSSDWMPRNFDRRVEVVAPIHDDEMKSYLKDEVLGTYLRDNVKARRLLPDGTYARVDAGPGQAKLNSQEHCSGTLE